LDDSERTSERDRSVAGAGAESAEEEGEGEEGLLGRAAAVEERTREDRVEGDGEEARSILCKLLKGSKSCSAGARWISALLAWSPFDDSICVHAWALLHGTTVTSGSWSLMTESTSHNGCILGKLGLV